jgi:hypothetical protein
VSERLRSKLNVKGCADSGSVSRTKFEVSLSTVVFIMVVPNFFQK